MTTSDVLLLVFIFMYSLVSTNTTFPCRSYSDLESVPPFTTWWTTQMALLLCEMCVPAELNGSHVRCLHGDKSKLWNVATTQPECVVVVDKKHGGVQRSFVTWQYLSSLTPLNSANPEPHSWQCDGNIQGAQPTFLTAYNPPPHNNNTAYFVTCNVGCQWHSNSCYQSETVMECEYFLCPGKWGQCVLAS